MCRPRTPAAHTTCASSRTSLGSGQGLESHETPLYRCVCYTVVATAHTPLSMCFRAVDRIRDTPLSICSRRPPSNSSYVSWDAGPASRGEQKEQPVRYRIETNSGGAYRSPATPRRSVRIRVWTAANHRRDAPPLRLSRRLPSRGRGTERPMRRLRGDRDPHAHRRGAAPRERRIDALPEDRLDGLLGWSARLRDGDVAATVVVGVVLFAVGNALVDHSAAAS